MTENISDVSYPKRCPKHPETETVITKSGSATLCPRGDCDFVIQHPTVKQESPMKSDKEKSKAALAEVPVNADKKAREAAIAEAVAKKKASKPTPAEAKPTPVKDAKPKKAKPEKKVEEAKEDDDMLSVSDIAKEVGIDPKRARAKLRAAGQTATEGRWPKVKRDSKAHAALVAILTPAPVEEEDDEENDDEDEE